MLYSSDYDDDELATRTTSFFFLKASQTAKAKTRQKRKKVNGKTNDNVGTDRQKWVGVGTLPVPWT